MTDVIYTNTPVTDTQKELARKNGLSGNLKEGKTECLQEEEQIRAQNAYNKQPPKTN